ncbi:hypothetical protein D3C87_1602740 [compost metagenome]
METGLIQKLRAGAGGDQGCGRRRGGDRPDVAVDGDVAFAYVWERRDTHESQQLFHGVFVKRPPLIIDASSFYLGLYDKVTYFDPSVFFLAGPARHDLTQLHSQLQVRLISATQQNQFRLNGVECTGVSDVVL